MKFSLLRKERAVGLDVGNGAVKALALERRRSEVVVVRRGVAPVETGDAAFDPAAQDPASRIAAEIGLDERSRDTRQRSALQGCGKWTDQPL